MMAQLKVFFIAAVFCGVFLSQSSALECYTCDMCDDGEQGTPRDCGDHHDVCLKFSLPNQYSVKKCGYRIMCTGDVELSLTDAIKNEIKDLVNWVIESERENTVTEVVHCCKGDLCNAASSPATALLLVAPMAVAALLQ